MFKGVIRIVLMIIGGVILGTLAAFIFGWVVMLLWNWLMPSIFGLPVIGFWKAWGLVVLAHILFKSGHHRPDHDHHHNHDNWKHVFRDKMRKHFGEAPASETAADA